MNKIKILLKALMVSIKIKGPLSMIVSLIGFPAALLPVILANQLRALTDELQGFMSSRGSIDTSLIVFGNLVGLYIAQLVISAASQYCNNLDGIKIQTYIKENILRHKCEVRYKYIENYNDFQNRIAFTEQFAGEVMAKSIGSIIIILQLMLVFISASVALWEISPIVVIVLYITGFPAAILTYLQQEETFKKRTKWMEEGTLAIHYYNMIAGASYLFNGQQEIRHCGLFNYLKIRWRSIVDDYLNKKNKLMVKHVKYNAIADFLRSVVYLGILLITAWKIYKNPALGLGTFALVYALSGQLQQVTTDIFVDIIVLVQNIPYMQEFFYLDELERESTGDVMESCIDGSITFKDVYFSYPGDEKNVLQGINIHIKNGEKIAIIGENGSGKSTFISLLCGMFEPKSGEISIGGASPITAREKVSVVFQDFARYETTLRENITVSDKKRTASDDDIMKLLKKINVSDIIEKQTNGLNETVGSFSEKANNLSGGQWQKISIARAAYKESANIMILDEPTSALDPIAEADLYRNFTELTGNKTTILISHRLGIAVIVDRILVFKNGRIIEDGSHKELIDKNGEYAQMYRAQAQWYQ